MNLGNFVEVVIARNELALEVLGQENQLHVDRLTFEFGQVPIVELKFDARFCS